MIQMDSSHLRLDELPLGDIALCRSDLLRLRRCAKHKIFDQEDDMLLAYGFAQQVKSCTGGSTHPKPNGYISITLRGRAYLDHDRKEKSRYLVPQLLSLLAVAVSLASLALDILTIIQPGP